MRYCIGIFMFLFLSSCDERFEEKELYGEYVPVNYKFTCDTIRLEPGDIYYRRVFDKNKKLVLEMTGKWTLERKTTIHFDSYFLNLDRDISKFPELLQDTLGGWGGSAETHNGRIQFCVGYYDGENCYQKIR